MRFTAICLAGCLWLVAALIGAAQEPLAKPTGQGSGTKDPDVGDLILLTKKMDDREVVELETKRRVEQRRMYEDIEVMRRILESGLRGSHSALTGRALNASEGKSTGVAFADYDGDGQLDLLVVNGQTSKDGRKDLLFENVSPNGQWAELANIHNPHHGQVSQDMIDGFYFKGQGVVYSLSLPVLPKQPILPQPEKSAKKPLSRWERTQRELRGQKVEEEKSPARPQETLVEGLLKLLAENGHHFSQLSDNESITVAITLQRAERCDSCHGAVSQAPAAASNRLQSGAMMRMMQGMAPQGKPGHPHGATNSAGTTRKDIGPEGADRVREDAARTLLQLDTQISLIDKDADSLEAQAQNQALLGDLHLKQGRHKDAVAAYQSAVEAYQKAVKRRSELLSKSPAPNFINLTTANGKSYLTAVELYTKLAQGALAGNDEDTAVKAYEKIYEYSRQVQDDYRKAREAKAAATSGQAAPSAATGKIALPSKLIISAPKKLLDLAGTGRIDFEAFKKEARVQFLSFPTSGQASQKSAGN